MVQSLDRVRHGLVQPGGPTMGQDGVVLPGQADGPWADGRERPSVLRGRAVDCAGWQLVA